MFVDHKIFRVHEDVCNNILTLFPGPPLQTVAKTRIVINCQNKPLTRLIEFTFM